MTWSILGEAAGVAAALALEQGISVQNVDTTELQRVLREQVGDDFV
jgi:hypothetical protein